MPAFRPATMRDRDLLRLAGVHPDLSRITMRLLDAMEVFGAPMFVTEGYRSDEKQAERFAQGRTTPGPIVSNADGIVKKSLHQGFGDQKLGRAVDCAFLDDPETVKVETYDPGQPWDVYGLMAQAYGLTWGGSWRTLIDRPHIELPLNWKGSALLL